MSVQIFLKIDPIVGPSMDTTYKGSFEALSFSWGASHSAKVADVTDIALSLQSSAASARVLGLSLAGKRVSASIVVRLNGEKPVEFLKYVLKGARVTSYQIAGSGERPTETWNLAFDQIRMQERDIQPSGVPGDWILIGWDDLAHKVLTT